MMGCACGLGDEDSCVGSRASSSVRVAIQMSIPPRQTVVLFKEIHYSWWGRMGGSGRQRGVNGHEPATPFTLRDPRIADRM